MNKQILVSLVAILVMVFAVSSVSADIDSIRVNNVEAMDGEVDFAAYAGQAITVQTTFTAEENASDVSMVVRIAGSGGDSVSTERFDVYEGNTYTRFAVIQLPSEIDPTEDLTLYVNIENNNGEIVPQESVVIKAQRESYVVEILDVSMSSEVESGSDLSMNIVLKNRGSHLSEDTFVKVSIPVLQVEKTAYFGDLSSVDESDPDKEDAAERKMLLSIPSNAAPGVYTLEVEAFNGDSSTVITKKVLVVGAGEGNVVVTPQTSKSFDVGEEAVYTMTLVNSGSKIKVYELVAESTDGLNVEFDNSVVALSAGTSQTVKVYVTAEKSGNYDFTVKVLSNGNLVETQEFSANVGGSSTSNAFSGNTAVVLTVVLAIIFVVLLVVLIVLLTRKPEKNTQEIGESYY